MRGAVALGLVMGSLLAAPAAEAQVVTYAITGSFTGENTGDAALLNAIGPILGTQPFTLDVAIDGSAAGAPLMGGGTVYRAISSTAMSMATFTGISTRSCTGSSDFICTVQVQNGTGLAGTGGDQYMLLSAMGHSAAFNTAVGEARPLDFQFIVYLYDYTGALLNDESVGFDFSRQSATAFGGYLVVFAPGQDGFDRANFGVRVSAITRRGAPAPAGPAREPNQVVQTPLRNEPAPVESADLIISKLALAPAALQDAKVSSRGAAIQARSSLFVAAVSNRGAAKWAADGAVTFALRAGGTDGPNAGARPGVPVPRARVGSVATNGTLQSSEATVRLERGRLAGSLAPGASAFVQGQAETLRRDSVVVLEFGRPYMVTATLRAAGERPSDNNSATRVFRVERARDGVRINWEPLRIGTTGTAAVTAPK